MSPAELESALRRRGIGFAELQRLVHPARFSISPLRAWLGLGRAAMTLAVGQACLLASPTQPALVVALTIVGWLVSATGLAGLFVVGHDCGHHAFSRTPWVNTAVGHLCMSPLLIGFHNWRRAHAHHHAHTQIRGEDTDWPEQMPTRAEYEAASPRAQWCARMAYGSFVGTLLGFPVAMVRRTFMRALYPRVKVSRRGRRELALSNALMVLASGGIIGGLWVTRGFGGMTRHYGIPMYLGMVLGTLFTYLHHSAPGARAYDRHAWSPLRGQVLATFDVRFPAWFEWLFFHINRHLPHHIEPRIPWYHLPRATGALHAAAPELAQDRRFGLRYLARAWAAPVLEPVADGAYAAGPVEAVGSEPAPQSRSPYGACSTTKASRAAAASALRH